MTVNNPTTGLLCPNCGERNTTVTDSRPARFGVRRRRECLGCRHRLTTIERPVADEEALTRAETTLATIRAMAVKLIDHIDGYEARGGENENGADTSEKGE